MKDDNVYIKKDNGRYEAIGLQYDRDWLGDGIWAVQHREGSTSIRNMSYYGSIVKVGETKYPDLSKLSGVLDLADRISTSDEFKDLMQGPKSWHDIINFILAKAVSISEEVEVKSNNRPLRFITDNNLIDDGFKNNGVEYRKRITGTWYEVVVTTNTYDNPRYSYIKVFNTYDHELVAEFKAECMHQIYGVLKLL